MCVLNLCHSPAYERDLEEDIKKKSSGKFEKLLLAELNGHRNHSSRVDYDLAIQDAKDLYQVLCMPVLSGC